MYNYLVSTFLSTLMVLNVLLVQPVLARAGSIYPTIPLWSDVTGPVDAAFTFVGNMSDTGGANGVHAHIQTLSGAYSTLDTVNTYFAFDGNSAEEDAVTDDEAAHRARGSRGIDIAMRRGTKIEAINAKKISPVKHDARSGNYRIIEFESEGFVVAHLK